jgi:hypothetical protein
MNQPVRSLICFTIAISDMPFSEVVRPDPHLGPRVASTEEAKEGVARNFMKHKKDV